MAFFAHERIICTGTEVWQYRCDTNQIFIYPLEKDVQQRALEEGPLPFLFNFKAAEAKKRYEMALVAEDAETFTIRIIPRLPIDQDSFKKAFVLLDRQLFLLPRRIFLLLPDEQELEGFRAQPHDDRRRTTTSTKRISSPRRPRAGRSCATLGATTSLAAEGSR